jgi:transketolase
MAESQADLVAAKAYELRCDVIEMIYHAGSGHAGGCMSCAEIVAALYWQVLRIDPARPSWEGRDRVVLSKGHAAAMLYAALARKGYFPPELLMTFRQLGSILQGHPDFRRTPGLDMTSGSLGQGLSVGLGMALAGRQARVDYDVYVVMSDGEMQEGMTWEAAMAAAHFNVANLTVVVDKNDLQVDGLVDEVMSTKPLAEKWHAFGWRAITVDGHDVPALLSAFRQRRAIATEGQPVVIICQTVKGKGISFMENVAEWHAGTLDAAQYAQALSELRPKAVLSS